MVTTNQEIFDFCHSELNIPRRLSKGYKLTLPEWTKLCNKFPRLDSSPINRLTFARFLKIIMGKDSTSRTSLLEQPCSLTSVDTPEKIMLKK